MARGGLRRERGSRSFAKTTYIRAPSRSTVLLRITAERDGACESDALLNETPTTTA